MRKILLVLIGLFALVLAGSAQSAPSFSIGCQGTVFPTHFAYISQSNVDIANVAVLDDDIKVYMAKVYLEFSVVEHVSTSMYACIWPGSVSTKITDVSDSGNKATLDPHFFLFGIENNFFFTPKNIGPYVGLSCYSKITTSSFSNTGTTSFTNLVKTYIAQMKASSYVGAMVNAGLKMPMFGKSSFVNCEVSYDPMNATGLVSAGISFGFGNKYF